VAISALGIQTLGKIILLREYLDDTKYFGDKYKDKGFQAKKSPVNLFAFSRISIFI